MRFVSALVLCSALLAFRADASTGLWFEVGESMRYEVHWLGMQVAEHEVTTSWTNHQGRSLIAIRHRTRSNGVVEKLYPVDIALETLIEPETFLPVYSLKRSSEGRKRQHEETIFDYAAGVARFENFIRNQTRDIPIDRETRDVVSVMYWIRKFPLVADSTNYFKVITDDKVYDLRLTTHETEEVKLSGFGKVRCHRVDPEASFDGLFTRKGRMTLWVSDDDRRLCARLIGQVPVASIKVTLASVGGPGGDRWTRSKSDESR